MKYRYYIHHRAVILNKKGIDDIGEVSIPENAKLLFARTITDGKSYDVYSRKKVRSSSVLSMPQLEVGSIVDYAYIYESRYKRLPSSFFFTYNWYFSQFDNSVENAEYIFISPDNISMKNFHIGVKPKISSKDNYTIYHYTKKKSRGKLREEASPHRGEILGTVLFSNFNSINDLTLQYQSTLKGKDTLTTDIRKLAAKLNLPTDNFLDKLRSVYYYINDKIRVIGSGIYYPTSCQTTLYRKKGTGEDKAVLASALYRVMGIDSEIIIAKPNFGLDIRDDFVTPLSYNRVFLKINGDVPIFLDFSSRFIRFGEIPDKYIRAEGISVVTGEKVKVNRFRDFHEDYFFTCHSEIDPDGRALITGSHNFRGYKSGFWRNLLFDISKRKLYVEKLMSFYMPGFNFEDFSIDNFYELEKDMILNYSGTADSAFGIQGKYLTLSLFIKKIYMARNYLTQGKRLYPLIIDSTENLSWDISFKIPEDIKVVSSQDKFTLETEFGYYRTELKIKDGGIRSIRSFKLHQQRIEPSEYPDFVEFCKKIDKFEEGLILLERREK